MLDVDLRQSVIDRDIYDRPQLRLRSCSTELVKIGNLHRTWGLTRGDAGFLSSRQVTKTDLICAGEKGRSGAPASASAKVGSDAMSHGVEIREALCPV